MIAWSLYDITTGKVTFTHTFEFDGGTAIFVPVGRVTQKYNELIKEEVEKMRKAGIIGP